MANISIDQLAAEITRTIQEYTQDVSEGIDKKVTEIADQVLQEVKATAPKKTGDYARTFTKTDKSLPGVRRYVIWNKKNYSLVHLLEFGHAKVNGGRVKAYPHMRPAHEKHAASLPDQIKKIIRNGGG